MSALTQDSSLLAELSTYEWKNKLYFGDNLTILQEYIPDRSVDLIYLDPPFNSSANYNILFKEKSGEQSAAQITAFEDTWHWSQESEDTLRDLALSAPGRVVDLIQALKSFLGRSDMMAYLTMMTPRLVELHRKLKDTGSLYLHCDPTASHYLRILLDNIFGPENFRNEIIWRRTGSHNSSKRFGPIHDTLLFYSKSSSYFFKKTYRPYLKGHVEGYFKQVDERGQYWTNALTGAGTRNGESGKSWKGYNPTGVGRHWAIPSKITQELELVDDLSTQQKLDALDEAGFIVHPTALSAAMPTYRQYLDSSPGMPLQDIWAYQPHTHGTLYGTNECIDEDVRWLTAQGDSERLGYPTQKTEGLLERIISSSCPENGYVLDPFCGCGTTISVAEHLHRRWIGIDITHLAISVIKNRLHEAYPDELAPYEVTGVPTDLAGAEVLALQDRYEFQYWALYLLAGRPAQDKKKGRDTGIDGLLYFYDGDSSKAKKIIIQVKSGHVKPDDIRALITVVAREKAQMGAFITLKPPTRDMKREAVSAGYYKTEFYGAFPKLQILTIEELLDGVELQYPHVNRAKSKRAERKSKQRQAELFTNGSRR